VERKGFTFFVDLDYENLPDFCTHCNMIGHYVENCKNLQAQDHNKKEVDNKMKSKLENPKPRVEKRYVQTNPGSMEHNKANEVVDVDESNHPVEGFKSQPVMVDSQASESSKSKSVPQALAVISPAHVEQQNKFSLLVNDDVEVDQPANEQHDNVDQPVINADSEVEFDDNEQHDNDNVLQNNDVVLEENFDIDSSQNSAFVDATQFQKEDNIEPVMPSERVQKDMNFLKQSWANIAELEEQDTSPKDQQLGDEGFQIKVSKQQKKAQKKLSQSSKDSYATRSKVNQRPFK
jgi:hypothetical protein